MWPPNHARKTATRHPREVRNIANPNELGSQPAMNRSTSNNGQHKGEPSEDFVPYNSMPYERPPNVPTVPNGSSGGNLTNEVRRSAFRPRRYSCYGRRRVVQPHVNREFYINMVYMAPLYTIYPNGATTLYYYPVAYAPYYEVPLYYYGTQSPTTFTICNSTMEEQIDNGAALGINLSSWSCACGAQGCFQRT